jgi:hypothetical protein
VSRLKILARVLASIIQLWLNLLIHLLEVGIQQFLGCRVSAFKHALLRFLFLATLSPCVLQYLCLIGIHTVDDISPKHQLIFWCVG